MKKISTAAAQKNQERLILPTPLERRFFTT